MVTDRSGRSDATARMGTTARDDLPAGRGLAGAGFTVRETSYASLTVDDGARVDWYRRARPASATQMSDILTGRDAPRSRAAPARRRPSAAIATSTRVRILGWYVVLLAVALSAGLLLQRAILLAQLNDEVNAQLRQEVEELKQLATGRNPNTGAPFGDDIAAIFDTFLRRNIPGEGEALFTLIDGQPHASTATPLQLLEDDAVVAEWSAITAPQQAELATRAGRVRYLAVPVLAEDGRRGIFVVAIFLQGERAEVDRALQTGAIVYGSIFVIASVVAWFAAGRVLRPVRLLTEAARSIKDDNWSRRIPVRGEDEIAQLTRTFNDMLDRLETAFVMQRRFIDDAGHELRTPITIIRGHLELLGDDPHERREVGRLVLDELDRMARIVDDLLLLARAEQPDFLDPHPLDLREFTEEVALKATALSGERQWRTAETAPLVINADRQRLTQALINLAANAVEHSGANSTITIGSHASNGVVRFWVRDEGAGIPVADQERVFERFAKGRGSGRRSEGAGLGLAIVKVIAEAHGGRVELASAPGRGATFTLVVPSASPGDGG